MLDAIKKDFDGRFKDAAAQGKMRMEAAYAGNPEEAAEWKEEIEKNFPGIPCHMDPLSLSVSCHVGPGVLAIACSKAVDLK